MYRFFAPATLLLLAAAPSDTGRTWHYVRSNIAGGEEEHVYVHRASPARLEVYKMRSRCTNAAFVSADIDPKTGEARRLTAATLLPDAKSRAYGTMTFDPASGTIRADVTMDKPVSATIAVTDRPWHLYDYDLATLSVATRGQANPRKDFSFGLALVWVDPDKPGDFLRWLGKADARFVRAERHLGRNTLRFAVGGPAFGAAGGGPLWIDSNDRTLVDVQWGRPNHAEYKDFRLRLIGSMTGEAAWTALLRRHFAGCPKS